MKSVLKAFNATMNGTYKGARKLLKWVLIVSVVASATTAALILGTIAVINK